MCYLLAAALKLMEKGMWCFAIAVARDLRAVIAWLFLGGSAAAAVVAATTASKSSQSRIDTSESNGIRKGGRVLFDDHFFSSCENR